MQCVQGVVEHAVERIRRELLPRYPNVDGVVGMEVGETKVVDYAVRRPRAIADDDVDRYQATVTVLSQQRKRCV